MLSKNSLIILTSFNNLTSFNTSADNSIAYYKPYSIPYAISTYFIIDFLILGSNISEPAKTSLKSAEPAKISPLTLGRLVFGSINNLVQCSETILT